MFQSIAFRATNPTDDLPDFSTHITSTHLYNLGERVRNDRTLNVLKRMADAFPTKPMIKKSKRDDANIFDKREAPASDSEDEDPKADAANTGLGQLLTDTKAASKKTTKIGTTTPVEDFQILADKLDSNSHNEFEDLCVQLQVCNKTTELLLK